MSENRRTGLTEGEVDVLAEKIALRLVTHNVCSFTPDEQASIRSLLKTKKWAAGVVLIGIGTILLWILKDAYEWARHMVRWGGQ